MTIETTFTNWSRLSYLQEIALNGEHEHVDESNNRGNFRKLLELQFHLHPQLKSQWDYNELLFNTHKLFEQNYIQ